MNLFKTSDIRISKDSAGFYSAVHKYQGVLIDNGYYENRAECRKDAVLNLRDIKDSCLAD